MQKLVGKSRLRRPHPRISGWDKACQWHNYLANRKYNVEFVNGNVS
jgi:hypothetical protein